MKSMIKITLIAAIAITAPAHAMFTRLNNIFTPKYTPMYVNRKPLFTLGTLLGAASLTAKKSAQAEASDNRCDWYIAAATCAAIQYKNSGHYRIYNDELKCRAFWFNRCEKILSRDEIYNRNIAYALNESTRAYNVAKEYPTSWFQAEPWFKKGHEYSEAALHLQKEQAQERSK